MSFQGLFPKFIQYAQSRLGLDELKSWILITESYLVNYIYTQGCTFFKSQPMKFIGTRDVKFIFIRSLETSHEALFILKE
jgi:hypothetical protein